MRWVLGFKLRASMASFIIRVLPYLTYSVTFFDSKPTSTRLCTYFSLSFATTIIRLSLTAWAEQRRGRKSYLLLTIGIMAKKQLKSISDDRPFTVTMRTRDYADHITIEDKQAKPPDDRCGLRVPRLVLLALLYL